MHFDSLKLLVPDQHQTTLNPKLRLVYEIYPMAFMWEACGGYAFTAVDGVNALDVPFPHSDLHLKSGVALLTPT